VQDGPTADATITGTAPSQTLNLTLPKGDKGDQGPKGDKGDQGPKGDKGDTGDTGPKGDTGNSAWTPVYTAVADGERRVLRIDDWTGGQGTKPATGYLGVSGIVATIGDALDIRGAPGAGAVSSVNSIDPDGSGNVDLGISDIPGLEDALDNAGQVKTVASKGPDSSGNVALVKADVGLDNVDNTSDENKPISTATANALANKVDKVTGKGLSSEDFTSALLDKLNGIAAEATKNSTDAHLLNRANHTGTQAASTITGLATVATSGSYNDLGDKPTIPTLAPIADTADIASLSGGDTITPGSLGTAAAAAGTISGGTSITFNWSEAVNYTMALTGNRTLPNPTNVLPGTTRVIVVSSSTGTTRTLAFGSNFVGDLPTVSVTNTSNMVLFLYAVSATKIVVSGVEI
jgi:hypothetical protein